MNIRCAIAAWLECFQEKPSWCRNKQVCHGRKSVKRFERSNGLDTALYIKKKNTTCIEKRRILFEQERGRHGGAGEQKDTKTEAEVFG